MVVSILFVVVCAAALVGALAVAGLLKHRTLPGVIMGGYLLRIVIQLFIIRDVQFFSHVVGGDSFGYEIWARAIAAVWERSGIHFVTGNELEVLGPTSLPPNLFALVAYADNGPSLRYGCTAIVALAAGLTALNLYTLAVQFGADKKRALTFASILYFQPSFLFYTSDMYKDGLVLCFVMAALGSSLRLAERFSARDAVIGLISILALWYVRFYLIFVTVAPLLVGVIGLRAKGFARSLVASLALAMGALVLASYTDFLQLASERASETFQRGTSLAVLNQNAEGGSGIAFDDNGSPFGALALKMAYTVFAPFPWAKGSLGFQIGKLDVFVWYFVIYRAVRASFHVERRLVIMLSTFIIPCTVMYAMGISNVGLIVRQRLVIVAATTILAALYQPKKKEVVARAARPVRPVRKLRAA